MKIDFECSYSSYLGLGKNHWKTTINGTVYGIYDFWLNIPFINDIDIFTSEIDSEWNVYITGLKFSWDSDFKFEHYIFKYLEVIDYLKEKKIPYLIVSKELTTFRTEAEKTVDVYNELIPNFYKNILYDYGSLTVYSTDEF